MKLELKYLLAACLFKIHNLGSDVEFNFKESCHSYSPCLIVKTNGSTTVYQLPLSFTEDLWVHQCSQKLSIDYDAISVKLLVDLIAE